MNHSIAGSRYARALVDVVLAPGSGLKAEDATAQLKTVEEWIQSSPDLRSIFITPAVPTSRKRAVLTKLAAEAGLAPMIRNFLCVILDHRRIAQLTEIRQAFETILDEQTGFVSAQVTSATALDDNQWKVIETELARMTGKQVRMHTKVDPELLGGVMAKVGSTVYDGSLRGQLEGMRHKLVSETLTTESTDSKVGN